MTGYDQDIEDYEPEALNKILEDFHATVRKKDNKDYTGMAVFALQLNVTLEGKVTNTPHVETESEKVRSKCLKVKPGYWDNRVS